MNLDDIPAVNRAIRRQYATKKGPVIELVKAQTNDPFKVLVATILSARTKDECTAEVSARLFRRVDKAADLRGISRQQLEKLIFPIGFFRTKARHLKMLPDVLDREFQGRIPHEIDDLCRLPGVGRKTANLVRSVAFDKHAICVDVHVHRISNRLGLVHTQTPLETEMELRRVLPRRYWKTWNRYLVSYGQTVCTPRNPKCNSCPILQYCDRKGAGTKHAPAAE
jgi:endonuclease III